MRDVRLLSGIWAALILAVGLGVLALFVPGYSAVRQTVSEIGELGSPMRWPFALLLAQVAACLLIFAAGVQSVARAAGRGRAGAFCIAWMAIAALGTGLFAFPHPLHNAFGISELIAYQAPLLCALAWRHRPEMRTVVSVSTVMYELTLLSLAVNLAIIPRSGWLWQALAPINGLVQRSLFACFFLWCALLG